MTERSLAVWLSNVIILFSDTLSNILNLPVLALFCGTALLMVLIGLLSGLVRKGRNGRL